MKINSLSVESFDNVLDEGRILFSYETDKGWNQVVFSQNRKKWSVNSSDKELLMSLYEKFLSDMGL
jgi:hypothetical protein